MKNVKEEVPVNNIGGNSIAGVGLVQDDTPVYKKNWAKRIKNIKKNIKRDNLLRR